MTPERWQQVNDLFQAAVDLAPERRAAFLDEACATDELLRAEVESLLASDRHDWKLIDVPALEVAAPFMAEDQPRLAPSQHLGHYEILSLLGKGGMGEVYLAKDEVLNRSVALKLLPTDYTRDKDRLRRFQQEARAVSALNHPNILTIHELGEVAGQQFIATEFVDGETLRQRMKHGRLSVSEALDVAIQVTGALTAAHQAGIVHRDIKPENIMLRPDGYVKVLDFGLAKLSEQREPALNARADSLDVSSDLVMGTIRYMSPEQARGLTVDPRSDIFSVGIVLYEMLTGRAPFKGETPGDLIKSIVRDEPPSLETYLTGARAKLEDVIRKTLSKERAQRYQTSGDLSLDLKHLKEELELESKLKRTARPSLISEVTPIGGDTLMPARAAISTGGLSVGLTASTAETLATRITRKASAALFLVFVLGAVGLAYALIKWTAARRESFEAMKLTKLPNPGGFSGVIGSLQNKYARISPDGKYLARVWEEGGSQSLWVQELETNSSTQIVPPAAVEYNELLFSPDGKDIYYVAYDNKSSPALYQVPALGGASDKLIDDVNFNATLSPDGSQFAFVRREVGGDRFLMVASVDGTGVRKLASRSGSDFYGPLAWSPDGKGVACACRSFAKTSPHKLIEILIADGSERPISPREWGEINDLAWLADGSGLIIAATGPADVFHQIWQVSYPSGEARRITNDLDDYSGISLGSNSTKLVTVQQDWSFNIWVAQAAESGDARKVTLSKEDGYDGLSWTPDGKIVYASSANGNPDIWIMDADGNHRRQLSHASGQNNMPHVSADGRFIVFVSNRSGTQSIWRMDVDGTNPKQLTTGSADVYPQVTPDGVWVIYGGFMTNTTMTIWKVSIDGGVPTQVIASRSNLPAISPDGKFLAYRISRSRIAVRQLSNSGLTESDATREFDILTYGDNYRWSRDGSALTYVVDQNDISNVWSQPIDRQPATQLTYFKSDRIAWFDWAPDGTHIALARGNVTRDVVLISNFK